MSATATVQARVEIKIDSNWGDDCTLAQVKKQATEEAIRKLKKLLSSDCVQTIGVIECVRINHYTNEKRM